MEAQNTVNSHIKPWFLNIDQLKKICFFFFELWLSPIVNNVPRNGIANIEKWWLALPNRTMIHTPCQNLCKSGKYMQQCWLTFPRRSAAGCGSKGIWGVETGSRTYIYVPLWLQLLDVLYSTMVPNTPTCGQHSCAVLLKRGLQKSWAALLPISTSLGRAMRKQNVRLLRDPWQNGWHIGRIVQATTKQQVYDQDQSLSITIIPKFVSSCINLGHWPPLLGVTFGSLTCPWLWSK